MKKILKIYAKNVKIYVRIAHMTSNTLFKSAVEQSLVSLMRSSSLMNLFVSLVKSENKWAESWRIIKEYSCCTLNWLFMFTNIRKALFTWCKRVWNSLLFSKQSMFI